MSQSKRVTIYHNPRCGKSRETLKRLEQHGCDIEVVEYLKTPPTTDELKAILKKLETDASSLVRRKDYRSLDLPEDATEAELIELMTQHPKIMERPIVVVGKRARIGRPPENVDEILP